MGDLLERGGVTAGDEGEGEEHQDHDEVVQHRGEGRHGERPPSVEQGRPQTGQAVEEHLGQEQQEERHGDLGLLGGLIGRGSQVEQADDDRGEQHGQTGGADECHEDDRGDCVDGLVVIPGEVLDHDGHERG